MLTRDVTRLCDVTARLEGWIRANGHAGYDPYDLQGLPFVVQMRSWRSMPLRLVRRASRGLIHALPGVSRRLFGCRRINAKAMGLLTAAYVNLSRAGESAENLQEARRCADWLLENPSPGYAGLCWGYPFHWQTVTFIPKGTPSSVVSATAADGLWRLAEITGEQRLRDACISVCEFFLHDLNRDEIDEETVCFSYTPLDDFHVHNANLFVAEFLARIGTRAGRRDYLDLAVRAGNYALGEQQKDGSLFYWGAVQDHYSPGSRDCYHSGFETRCLWGLWNATGDRRFRESALRYLDFFYEHYLREGGALWLKPEEQYPVDIHGCAEALLCPAAMRDADPERFRATWANVLGWVVRRMQNRDGSFAYRAYESGRVDRTAYMRWGQAWMLRALSEILVAAGKEDRDE